MNVFLSINKLLEIKSVLKIKQIKRILIPILLVSFNINSFTQQLDKIGEKDPLKINGGVAINQLWRNNVTHPMKPYSLVATGNLTANVYGMSIPLSFTWSNEQWTYSQPFNRFSLSPSYKWATLHLGWASMNFSTYSLSSHSFLGAGVELSPDNKFRFSAMHGELVKAFSGDTVNRIDPSYQRIGSGAKLDYSFDKGEVSLILFKATDNYTSHTNMIDSLGIVPLDNIVFASKLTVRPIERLSVTTELHKSSISNDRRISSAGNFNGDATYQHHAANMQLSFSTNVGNIGAGIEYVEPGYTTLGAYYTINDFINYTVNYSTSLINGKLNIAANNGIRVNNLNNNADSNRKDVISSFSIGIIPSDKLMLNLAYSNFYNYTHVRPLIDELIAQTDYELMDTLRFTQINESVNLGANWRVADSEVRSHSIMANIGFQQASQSQTNVAENAGSNFVNGATGYQFNQKERNLNSSLNINYSRSNSSNSSQESIGPALALRKAYPDYNISTNVSLGWNGTLINGIHNGNITTYRFAIAYTIKEVHKLGLNSAYNYRVFKGNASNLFTASINYSYNFGWPKNNNSNKINQ